MQIRANSIIHTDSKRVDKPLPIMEAWANSSHVALVYPDCVMSGMTLKVWSDVEKRFTASVNGTLHPIAGYWYFYIPRSAFVAGGGGYKIVGKDERNSRTVFGDGWLRVKRSNFPDITDEGGGEESSDNAYISVDGTWYAIRVERDESGASMFSVVGIGEPPSYDLGQPYAYNLQTGMYHKVNAFKDESGAIALELESQGEEAQGSFALGVDGMYHRIEAVKDETGSLALQVGEGQ